MHLARDDGEVSPAVRASALLTAAVIFGAWGPVSSVRASAEGGLAIARQLGDPSLEAQFLGELAWADYQEGVNAAQAHLEEAADMADGASARLRWGIRGNLGLLHSIRADVRCACLMWLAALELCEGAPALRDEPVNYLGAGLCLAVAGDHQRAAELFGTADALMHARGEAWEPLEGRLREEHQCALREQMGAAKFDSAYDRGRSLTAAQAFELTQRELRRLT